MKTAPRVVLDCCVIVAAFKADEVHHGDAADFVALAVSMGTQLCAPTLIFPEMAAALVRSSRSTVRATQLIKAVREWLPIEIHAVDAMLANEAETLAANCFLRGADSIYAALAKLLNVPLITFDRELLERSGSFYQAVLPVDWMRNCLR